MEYWKSLYEKIEEKNISVKDKKLVNAILEDDQEEEKQQIA